MIDLRSIYKNYYIVQNFKEFSWLLEKVEKLNPTAILEVGVEAGGSLKCFEQVLEQNGKYKKNILIGIDISPNMLWDIKKSNITTELIIGNSHDTSTLDKVKRILFNGTLSDENMIRQLDFVYIDGEHTPNAARTDFEIYSSLVRKGGAVGFHDYYDVKKFLDLLNIDRLEMFQGLPPFEKDENGKDIGVNATIGTAIYYV